MEMKQNGTFFYGTYSIQIPVLIGRKKLDKFNDFYIDIVSTNK